MMIRQDFQELPPKMFLMQVMDNICKTYVFLWDGKDNTNRVYVTWKDLVKSHSKNSFRTSVRKLNNHGLLNYEEADDGMVIELVDWNEITDE